MIFHCCKYSLKIHKSDLIYKRIALCFLVDVSAQLNETFCHVHISVLTRSLQQHVHDLSVRHHLRQAQATHSLQLKPSTIGIYQGILLLFDLFESSSVISLDLEAGLPSSPAGPERSLSQKLLSAAMLRHSSRCPTTSTPPEIPNGQKHSVRNNNNNNHPIDFELIIIVVNYL